MCRYEELEAISVSERLSKLDVNDAKEQSHDDDGKTNTTSSDSHAVSSEVSDEKHEEKLLGICQYCAKT